jgi:hypothetical protein
MSYAASPLRQPYGFEGFGLVASPEELALSKSVLELRDKAEGRVRDGTATGAAQPESAKDEHDAVVLSRSVNVESRFCEGLAHVSPELPHFGVASVDALQRRAASDVVVDLHIRREGFECAGVVARVPFFKRANNDFDVFPRHRLLSQPRSFEGVVLVCVHLPPHHKSIAPLRDLPHLFVKGR